MAMTPSKEALEAAEAFCESIYDAYGPIPIPAVARALDAFAAQCGVLALNAMIDIYKREIAQREQASWDAAVKALREQADIC